MSVAGQVHAKEFHRGQVDIDIDLPKGEKLKSAKACLNIAGKPLTKARLKKGRTSIRYYSQSGDEVSVTVEGAMNKNRGVFSETFTLKGGTSDPAQIRLSFSKPTKEKKANEDAKKAGEAKTAQPAQASARTAQPQRPRSADARGDASTLA